MKKPCSISGFGVVALSLCCLSGCGGYDENDDTVVMAYDYIQPETPPADGATPPLRQPSVAETAASEKQVLNDAGIQATVYACVATGPDSSSDPNAITVQILGSYVLYRVPGADVKAAEKLGLFVADTGPGEFFDPAKATYSDCFSGDLMTN